MDVDPSSPGSPQPGHQAQQQQQAYDPFRPSPFPLPNPHSPSPAPASPPTNHPAPGHPSAGEGQTLTRTPLRFSDLGSLEGIPLPSLGSFDLTHLGFALQHDSSPSSYPGAHGSLGDFRYLETSPARSTGDGQGGEYDIDMNLMTSGFYPSSPLEVPQGVGYDMRDSRGGLGVDVRTSLADLDMLGMGMSSGGSYVGSPLGPGGAGAGGDGGERAMSLDPSSFPDDAAVGSLASSSLSDPTAVGSPPAGSSSSNTIPHSAAPGAPATATLQRALPHPNTWALPPTLLPVPAPTPESNPYQTELHLRDLLAQFPTLGPVYITSPRWVQAWYELCERRWVGGRYWPEVDVGVGGEVRRSRDVALGRAGAAAGQGAQGMGGQGARSQMGQGGAGGGGEGGGLKRRAQHYAFSEFEWSRTLGTGTFGRVILVRSNHNGRLFAVKVLNKSKIISLFQVEHTNAERLLLFAASHPSEAAYDSSSAGRCPFLVSLYGSWQDRTNVYLVMEYVSGGELYTLLRRAERFPVSVARFYAAEVVLALGYLHRMDIIYRDLKPENILITPSGHIKLTDFGFAKYVPDITFTLCGTPDYLAPELIAHMPYTKSVDWYSLGILVYEMLVGTPPFVAPNPAMLYQRILDGRVTYPREWMGDLEVNFLQRTMTKDLSRRYGHRQAQVSEKSRASVSSVSSLQGVEAAGDHGTEDVMLDPFFSGIHWETLEGSAGEYFGRAGGIRVPWIPGEGINFEKYNEVDFAEYNQPPGDTGEDGALFPEF